MYCRADGMMMVAKAVITGHHCGYFQSVQKSQSPANNCLVISAAPATTKIAVTQKTRSHLRSIHLYCLLSRARSSSRRCRSAAVIGVAAIAVRSLPFYAWAACCKASVRHHLRPRRRLRALVLFGLFDLKQPQDGFAPNREHPARQPSVDHEGPVKRHREKFF